MTNILNPYIAGAPVVETSMFFGREDIFGWIERSLTGKFVNHILVLHGQRRVGKTSVLKQIPRHLPQNYVQVFFDLQGRTNTTLERFLWWMASEISRTLKKECNLDLPKIERNAFAEPDAFINDFLPSLREQLLDRILLLTFDEFDTLDRPDIQDSLARPLVAYLRRLMEIEGLNFIFSIGSSGNKLENMQASYTDFFKSALYRKVSFLTKDDCMRLITKPVEGTISYEPVAVEKISHYTSGHPYFTQLMCHELFSRCQKTGSRTITAGDVDSILEDVIERGTVNLKFVWDEASDLEKWILAALAQEEGAPLKRIHQILKIQGLRSSEADLNSAVLHLRDKDVLDADNGFVIQLMKLWLQTNRPMDRVREELVQTNPITDRYIEIGDEYRERGENQQAIQSYEQALAVQENDIRALQNIAAIHLSQNSFEPATKYFARILRIDEENIAAKQGFIQAQIYLAKKAIKEGNEVEAEKAIRSILMIAPSHVEATKLFAEMYVQKAETLLQNGLEDQAFEKFQQAIEISPDDESIRNRYEKILAEKKASQVQVWLDKAEKSLARQRWDEAASMVDEALNIDPENPELQKRLLEIKDTPRQEKIKVYKLEAEQAIAKGNYPKAISAIQTAILLAPEDSSLKQWLESIQSDQANAQLRMYQSQADQAEAGGNWEAAIAAREAALKLDPQNERLAKALQSTKEAKQKQQINSLRLKMEQAKKEQNWEAALIAGEEYLQFSPDDQNVKNDLEDFRIGQRKSRLAGLKTQAQSASKAEKWEDTIQHWQAYLAEKPEDGARVEKLIEQAKQKAALLKDYEAAQAHIRKHQYNRAIHLLQGIIAKDPTYKASSRLLVEAVEANKQKKPIWKTPWIYVGGGVLILAVVVIIMLPQIKNWMNSSNEPTSVVEVMETQTESGDSVFVPNPFGYALDRRVWYQISESGPNLALTKKPTFQDYFDEGNPQPYWQPLLNENHIFLVSDMFKIYDGAWYTNEYLLANNFLLEFEYFTENGLENNITHIDINSGTEIFYRFSISNNGQYKEVLENSEGEWTSVPNWTSYKLENDNTIKVKLIKNENEMTVFVNEVPLVYHKEFFEDENFQIILNFEGDQNRSVIWLQSIRFWNLEEPDFINSLLSQIENITPTFQDDLHSADPQPYWEDLLAEQRIVVKYGWEMYANTKYVNENLRAKDFVFEFEYFPQDYDPDSYVNLVLSRGHYYSFSLSNNGEFIEYLYGNKSSGKAIQNWEEFLKNNDYVIKIRLIASNNTLAILVNDQTVVFHNDENLNDEVNPIINILSSNENEPVVRLRNIKYWNLIDTAVSTNSQPSVSTSPTPTGSIITVSIADEIGIGSIRWAMSSAKQYDTIIFDPQVFPPDQPTTIFVTVELPRITQGYITLDASNAGVILDGSKMDYERYFGLIISSDYNKVMGLQIINFTKTIGVYIEGGSNNQIGGDRTQGVGPLGQGNLISNNGVGMQLLSSCGGNVITGNLIGTKLNGFSPMGNGGFGISIEKNQTISPIPNTIGPDNIIAYNGTGGDGPGIEIMSGMLHTVITENSIFGNGGKGINYLENDAEVEPPAIIYHDIEKGVLSGMSYPGGEVEIFSTEQNEGDKFEGAVKVDDFGNFVFNKGEPFSGPNLTAIAISSANKSSEFSNPPSPNSAMRAALVKMQAEPTYQTSFDVWEFGDPGENVMMENGKLILPTEGNNVGQGLSDKISDKFSAQFEFQIPESDIEGTCFFGMSNEEMNRSFGIGFRSDGISFAEQYVHPNQYPRIAEGNYEYYADQPNVGLVIVMGDQISVFVNDQLVYSFYDPQGSAVYNQQSVNGEWGVTCEFDNYKIWNLSGVVIQP